MLQLIILLLAACLSAVHGVPTQHHLAGSTQAFEHHPRAVANSTTTLTNSTVTLSSTNATNTTSTSVTTNTTAVDLIVADAIAHPFSVDAEEEEVEMMWELVEVDDEELEEADNTQLYPGEGIVDGVLGDVFGRRRGYGYGGYEGRRRFDERGFGGRGRFYEGQGDRFGEYRRGGYF